MPVDLKTLLEALVAHEVKFVVVGGMALVSHGSARTTDDLDICYSRAPENLDALSTALSPFRPTLRGAPRDLPFRLDVPTLKAGLNFTLESDAGDIDLLGELAGVGGYEEVSRDAEEKDLYGRPVQLMSLDTLERSKRAAGRRKDLLDLADIRAIRERTGR